MIILELLCFKLLLLGEWLTNYPCLELDGLNYPSLELDGLNCPSLELVGLIDVPVFYICYYIKFWWFDWL